MTTELKYNLEDSNFDAALVYIYTATSILDLIRIFDEECSVAKLNVIKRKYLGKIK